MAVMVLGQSLEVGGSRNNLIICNSIKTKKNNMSIEMYIVGGVIWVAYMYFTIWNIWHNSKSAKKDK
jgi:hypothetical protein